MLNEKLVGWGTDLVRGEASTESFVGLEAFGELPTQGQLLPSTTPWFNPLNIKVDQGLFYATLYMCDAFDTSIASQQLGIWLGSLKSTDYIHLNVMSLTIDVPLANLLSVMSAISACRATVEIHLDCIVSDSLAYFYLLADKITRGTEGAMFIPSYVDGLRDQDKSGPWRAVFDFYKWMVDDAVTRKLLTAEEAGKLHRGQHVIIPDDRFMPKD